MILIFNYYIIKIQIITLIKLLINYFYMKIHINWYTNNCRFKIQKYRSWNIFPTTSFAKESLKTLVAGTTCRWKHAIGLYAMFKTIQFPTSVAHLDAALANMN